MIQEALMEILETECPEVKWSVGYFNQSDDTGTVYFEGGEDPHPFDPAIYYPTYGVLIRSSNWDKAERYAYLVSQSLHKRRDEFMDAYLYKDGKRSLRVRYHVLNILQRGDMMDLGVMEDGVREWKVNFDTTIHKIKEEELT